MDSVLRMERILALIEAKPGICGLALAADCGVPWPLLQKDLETILLDVDHPIPLYTDADEDGEEGMDRLCPETRWFLETSQRRNVPAHFTVGEFLQILDALDFIEQKLRRGVSLKEKISAGLDLVQEGTYRYIKGRLAPLQRLDDEILLTVEKALQWRRKISFEFKSWPLVAAPLGVVYYSRLRQWYLAAESGGLIKTYNLAKVRHIGMTGESFTYPEGFSLRDWLAPRWGMEFGRELEVKVRFLNRSQTFAKVRKDVAHRSCLLREEDGGQSLIYEDTIVGKNEFLAWILGFGSAAEILEPAELRGEIISRVKECLSHYRQI
ncbi:WYL domain protein [Acididesulfobacillus acetoxydans]|uniref:WYL domain n=1 Tax=Acididesulfobacillus acetoxydans TaxID=1561005 RepID=A0A8S0W6Y5_9FIRM|nr:WYL domain-containing protein [Acididesulfobacillus acetoxydans]CAA7600239.1 WYL domain protein [Acididesulfobacillus acetoxydans]CEJ09617.1 WYL domain [Acididesulfobacillus acetoxydans]